MGLTATIFALVTAGDMLLPFVVAAWYPGYRHRTMAMSVLGGSRSPLRRIYNCWLVGGGMLFAAGTVLLFRQLGRTSPLHVALLALLLAYALGGMMVAGLFSVGADKGELPVAARIHGVGAAAGFVALLGAGPVIAAILFRRSQAGLGWICCLIFCLALGFFALFVLSDKKRFAGSWVEQEGTWQRILLLLMYLPPLLCARALFPTG